MTHKSRFWRDIDKHPLPESNCDIDVKLKCGSILIGCRRRFWVKPERTGAVYFNDVNAELMNKITQWRDAK